MKTCPRWLSNVAGVSSALVHCWSLFDLLDLYLVAAIVVAQQLFSSRPLTSAIQV